MIIRLTVSLFQKRSESFDELMLVDVLHADTLSTHLQHKDITCSALKLIFLQAQRYRLRFRSYMYGIWYTILLHISE